MGIARHNKILLIVAVLSILICIVSIFSLIFFANKSYHNLPNDNYLISDMDINKYSLNEEQSMDSLRSALSFYTDDAQFSIYVEDYSTGNWLGINENNTMYPASLLKVLTLVAVLKKVENKELSLNHNIRLNSEDLDIRSGSLGMQGAGHIVPIKELIIDMIIYSDNTALLTLNRRVITDKDVIDVTNELGLFSDDSTDVFNSTDVSNSINISVSPKELSDIFRSIYFSDYLNREYSNMALNILSKTAFRSQLPASIPHDVIIAHKVGFYLDGGYYHDCGIVYVPDRPYFICVMSSNVTKREADLKISEISSIVYGYMSSTSS